MGTRIEEEELPEHWARGCSNAKRWVHCPGSLDAEHNEDSGGFMADVGTLGHKITEQITNGYPIELTDEDRELLDQLDEDQRVWFKKAIRMCVEYVKTLSAKYEASEGVDVVKYESKVKSVLVDDHGGTVDVTILSPITLHVVDYKFGSQAVEADDNEQVMSYLNLAREKYGERKNYFGTIVQPSYRGAETYRYTKEQLDHFRERMIAATKSKERKGDPSWCKYCPLLDTCDAAAKMTISAVDEFGTLMQFINKADGPTPENVERLERIVLMHKIAKDAYDSASKILKDWYNQGANLNYHRVSSSNIRTWKRGAYETVVDSLDADEVTDALKIDLVTPAQLQKQLGLNKKEFNERFKSVLETTSRPSLKAGVKPSPNELAQDLPIFEG